MHIPEPSKPTSLSRRDVIVLGIGAFAVAAVPFSLRRRRALIRRSVPLMGTIAEIAVLHEDRRCAHAAIDAAVEELCWVEHTMSRFSPTSDVGRANAMAAAGPVHVSRATASVLEEALRWAEVSDGAFDPCIGRSVALWDVTNRREPPAAERVRRLAGRKLYQGLGIDTRAGAAAVRFRDADVALDLGGIAKGYGVDRAVQALRNRRIRHGLVNVGGDLYAIGKSEDGDPWKVGIRSPENPSEVAGMLEVSDGAVATSGDYMQFFEHRGRRYHHLLDPATGAPRTSVAHSVTVAADRCMTADAGATAVFGLPASSAERLLQAAAPRARIVSRA